MKKYLIEKYSLGENRKLYPDAYKYSFYFEATIDQYLELPENINELILLKCKNLINLNNLPKQLKKLKLYGFRYFY